jgi:hypothetical protein
MTVRALVCAITLVMDEDALVTALQDYLPAIDICIVAA